MKTLITITLAIALSSTAMAQDNSVYQGVRLPRMTEGQRNGMNVEAAVGHATQGLLIYNSDKQCIEFWNGSEWVSAWTSKGNNGVRSTDYIGTNHAADLVMKTNNNERMRIDKDGKVFLKNVGRAHENVAQLAIDNVTGEVFAVKTETNFFPMNYLQYVITTAEGDWIRNFNTRIPVSEYTLIVVGSSFKNGSTAPAALKLSTSVGQQLGTFSPQEVLAFEQGGTWRLKADYIDSNPGDGENGTWTIYCIAINNSLVKKFTPQIHTMIHRDDAAPSKPVGL